MTKIQGGVVAGVIKKQITVPFANLCRQIKNGLQDGYLENQVFNGVVNGMGEASSVRAVFEGPSGEEKTLQDLRDFLRSYYEMQDSATLLKEMEDGTQGMSEKEKDFVCRMINLRYSIVCVSEEEGCPLGEKMVKKRFAHALSVGFRSNTVRIQMQTIL